jgi:hypothetical protein
MISTNRLLYELGYNITLQPPVPFNAVLVFPTMEHLKSFQEDFRKYMADNDESVGGQHRIKQYKYFHGMVYFTVNPQDLRGLRLTHLYVSNRLSDIQKQGALMLGISSKRVIEFTQ